MNELILTDISLSIIILLFFVGLLAGFIDSIAGGGGLITLPALLLANLSPIEALSTNKLQSSCGTFAAASTMVIKKKAHLRTLAPSIFSCALAAGFGAYLVQQFPATTLKILIPIILFMIGSYFLFAPRIGEVEQKPRVGKKAWRYGFVPVVGFYDGYLGPGTGMFFTLGGIAMRGKEIIRASANARVLNFTSNLASLIIFLFSGKIVWLIGFIMIGGQIIGGWLGAHVSIKGGGRIIRPLIVIMCYLMLMKYVYDIL